MSSKQKSTPRTLKSQIAVTGDNASSPSLLSVGNKKKLFENAINLEGKVHSRHNTLNVGSGIHSDNIKAKRRLSMTHFKPIDTIDTSAAIDQPEQKQIFSAIGKGALVTSRDKRRAAKTKNNDPLDELYERDTSLLQTTDFDFDISHSTFEEDLNVAIVVKENTVIQPISTPDDNCEMAIAMDEDIPPASTVNALRSEANYVHTSPTKKLRVEPGASELKESKEKKKSHKSHSSSKHRSHHKHGEDKDKDKSRRTRRRSFVGAQAPVQESKAASVSAAISEIPPVNQDQENEEDGMVLASPMPVKAKTAMTPVKRGSGIISIRQELEAPDQYSLNVTDEVADVITSSLHFQSPGRARSLSEPVDIKLIEEQAEAAAPRSNSGPSLNRTESCPQKIDLRSAAIKMIKVLPDNFQGGLKKRTKENSLKITSTTGKDTGSRTHTRQRSISVEADISNGAIDAILRASNSDKANNIVVIDDPDNLVLSAPVSRSNSSENQSKDYFESTIRNRSASCGTVGEANQDNIKLAEPTTPTTGRARSTSATQPPAAIPAVGKKLKKRRRESLVDKFKTFKEKAVSTFSVGYSSSGSLKERKNRGEESDVETDDDEPLSARSRSESIESMDALSNSGTRERHQSSACRDRSGADAFTTLDALNVYGPDAPMVVWTQPQSKCGSHTSVTAGNLEALVKWLLWLMPPTPVALAKSQITASCQCQRSDSQILSKFLLTYHTFTNFHQLKEVLNEIYVNDPSQRFKVARFIKELSDKNPPAALKKLMDFASIFKNEYPEIYKTVSCLLIKAQNAKAPVTPEVASRTNSDTMKIKADEMAQQLTFLQYKLFKAIELKEFADLAWTKPATNSQYAPHICALINQFNTIGFWVATRVVSAEDNKERAKLIKKFIELGEKCLELHNYNSLMAVIAGLNNSSVSRLKDVWAAVPTRTKAIFGELEALMETRQNYKNYRQHLTMTRESMEASGETQIIVPYLGVYLRDLVFLEEGNQTFTEDKLINYSKVELMGAIFEEVWQLQQAPEPNKKDINPTYQRYFSNLHVLSDDELYELSKKASGNLNGSTNSAK